MTSCQYFDFLLVVCFDVGTGGFGLIHVCEGAGDGDSLHEHLAPEVLFSVDDFSQLHCMAGCLPQEHFASLAQMQPPSRPQQVAGTAPVVVEDIVLMGLGCGCGWIG